MFISQCILVNNRQALYKVHFTLNIDQLTNHYDRYSDKLVNYRHHTNSPVLFITKSLFLDL